MKAIAARKRVWHLGLWISLLAAGGCAFGDRHVATEYSPVMSIKAKSSVPVTVGNVRDARDVGDAKQIGQVRNGYNMVTAKVLCSDGTAMDWVRRALADELTHAGFKVASTVEAKEADGDIVITAEVHELLTDMSINGYSTRVRVNFIITRGGTQRMAREFTVEDGGSGITGSSDEYQTVTVAAMKKLMRRSIPEIIAAIEH